MTGRKGRGGFDLRASLHVRPCGLDDHAGSKMQKCLRLLPSTNLLQCHSKGIVLLGFVRIHLRSSARLGTVVPVRVVRDWP